MPASWVSYSMFKSKLDVIVWSFILSLLTGCATQNIDIFEGKNFRVIEVNGYKLPSSNTDIKVGTCNPTWGYYSLDDGHIAFDSIGNLKQTACSELIELSDGTIQEVIGTVPSTRTEIEFIRIGKGRFKLINVDDQLHFVDQKNKKFVVLER